MRARGLRPSRWWLAAAILLTIVVAAVPAVAVDTASISGRVIDTGGSGISGVTVSAVTPFWYELQGSVTTDANGYYTIEGLSTSLGGLIVTFDPAARNVAESTDYIAEIYDDAPYLLSATQVPPGTGGVDAALAAGGSISGHVYAPGGTTGLMGVPVEVSVGSLSTKTLSGAGGAYQIRGIPAGDAPYLGASSASYNADNDTDYLNASASGFVVSTGADTPGVDLVLGQGGRIEGTVTGGGESLGGVQVRASGGGMLSYSAYTASNGTYVLRGVAPLAAESGYRVSFFPSEYNAANDTGYAMQYYDSVHTYGEATLVGVVAGASTPDIDGALVSGGSISGTVYDADGVTPLEGVRVSAHMTGFFDVTDAEGRYSLKGLSTGGYRVSFDPTDYNTTHVPGYYAEYYNGAANLASASYVPVTFGLDTSGIDATLDQRRETISGTVYGADGAPLEGIDVFLVDSLSGMPYGVATTAANGTYTIANVGAGSWYIHFSPRDFNSANGTNYRAEYYDGAFLPSEATPVSAGATNVNATLVVETDTAPPVTELTANPVAADGNSGWYTDLSVTLTSNEPGSTWYSYDSSGLPKTEYTGPFTPTSGTGTLYYWSVDEAHNAEDAQSWAYKLDTVDPAAPLGLSATADGHAVIDLSWSEVADVHSGTVGYLVYLADHTYVGQTTATTYRVAGLDPETEYGFYVQAVDGAGRTSAASATAGDVTGAAPDTTPPVTAVAVDPAVPDGDNGWYKTAPTITLTTEPGATTYHYWDTDDAARYTDSLEVPEGEHTLHFYSVDAASNTEAVQTLSFKVDATAPAAPGGLAAVAAGSNAVNLSWSEVVDTHSGTAGYLVYRDGVYVGETTGLTYQVTGLTAKAKYTFTVTAKDMAGQESAPSDEASAKTAKRKKS